MQITRMKNVQDLIEERIDQMARDVMMALRAAAVEALNNAFGSQGVVNTTRQLRQAPKSKPTHGSQKAAPKRSAEQIAELSERLYALIDADPGNTMASYCEKLGLTALQLAVPAGRLKKARRVRKVGERSETRYFPMGSAP